MEQRQAFKVLKRINSQTKRPFSNFSLLDIIYLTSCSYKLLKGRKNKNKIKSPNNTTTIPYPKHFLK